MKKILNCALALFLSLAIMAALTPITGTVQAASKLKAPKVTVTATTDTTVSLSWSKVKGAKSYTIAYMNDEGSFETIATQKGKTVTINNLTEDTYYVFAVSASKAANGANPGAAGKVSVTTGVKTTLADQIKSEVEPIYDVSDDGLALAEEVSATLAFDQKYADSNEGFRTSGSAAEHKAAYYLADKFEDLGLDVTIDKVPVDKWQFNDARLTVTDESGNTVVDLGTDQEVEDAANSIVSYAASGTKQAEAAGTVDTGTYEDGVEIVYCGTGSQDDIATYAPDGIEGKIALVGIDPYGTSWITAPYNECVYQGAIGVISFNVDTDADEHGDGYAGYARYDKDANHVQDICSEDLGYPCANISYNNAQKIIAAQSEGTVTANLYVDNVVKVGGGKTYNVTATLEGIGNTGQRMVYAGHYDKYFYGYEDDCLAVGLVFGIAKSMVDAGYQPQNDIVFIAHGAEEWGKSGTSYDWAQGSYQEITYAHPEWQGSTLALFDFECPGIDNGYNQVVVSSVESAAVAQGIIDSGVLEGSHGDKKYYASNASHLALSYADTIGFEQNGVPCFMNYSQNAKSNTSGEAVSTWFQNRYHTQYDTVNADAPNKGESLKDDGQYSSDLMRQQIDTWSAFGVSYDLTPALILDFQSRIDMLNDAMFDENGNNTTVASKSQAKAYKKALNKLAKAASKHKAAGEKINAAYNAALEAGDTVALDKAYNAAIAYNKKALKAFRAIQDNLISMDIGDYSSEITHTFLQNDYELITKTATKLASDKSTERTEEALTTQYYALWALASDPVYGYVGITSIDSWLDYTYGVSSSYGNLDNMLAIFTNDVDTWGKVVQKTNGLQNEWKTTNLMYMSEYYSEYYPSLFMTSASLASSYNKYAKTAKNLAIKYINAETKSMNKIANIF